MGRNVTIIKAVPPHDLFTLQVIVLSGDLEPGVRYKCVPVKGDSPKVAADASDTSRAAAERVEPKVGTQRALVLQALRQAGFGDRKGWTDSELSRICSIPLNSVRPRRLELVEQGWVRDSGRVRDGSTVWELVE